MAAELARRTKAALTAATLGGLALVAASIWAFRERRAELARAERTRHLLERLARDIRGRAGAPPFARAEGGFTGQEALRMHLLDETRADLPIHLSGEELTALLAGALEDGWGRPIRYASPGPVHRPGWDLWSFGPDGRDDRGAGDDLAVGEDVAPVGT